MSIKKSLLASGVVATLTVAGVGGVGIASAATDTSSSGSSSLIDKLVSKFNLNKDEVQAVFDEERQSHEAERKADQAERLKEAVSNKEITQDQADYITKALAEIDALRGDSSPDEKSDDTRAQVREKMDTLRTWAEDNDIDHDLIGHGHHGGGPGRGMRDGDTTSEN